MNKLLNMLVSAGAAIAGSILVMITVATGVTIFGRFFGWFAPGWIVQFVEYGLFWIPLLGAAWLIRNDRHVNVDIMISRMKPRGKKIMHIVHYLLGMLVCIILLYSSSIVWLELRTRRVMDLQVIDMPKYVIITVLPIGFLLMTAQFLAKLIQTIRRPLTDGKSVFEND